LDSIVTSGLGTSVGNWEFETRTDRAGLATVPIAAPGEWLVSAVHMVPSEDRAAADWQSYWASLSFARVGR